jgi:hypothetical protein
VASADDAPDPDATRRTRCRSVLVRYDDGPDRRTFYPAHAPMDRVLGEWISVDDDVVRSLEAWR